MASVYKVIGQVAPANTSNADLYTVPTGKSLVVSSITLTNSGAVDAAATIWIRVAGAATSRTNILVPAVNISAGTMTSVTIGATLGGGDIITVKTSVADTLTFQAFGSENN